MKSFHSLLSAGLLSPIDSVAIPFLQLFDEDIPPFRPSSASHPEEANQRIVEHARSARAICACRALVPACRARLRERRRPVPSPPSLRHKDGTRPLPFRRCRRKFDGCGSLIFVGARGGWLFLPRYSFWRSVPAQPALGVVPRWATTVLCRRVCSDDGCSRGTRGRAGALPELSALGRARRGAGSEICWDCSATANSWKVRPARYIYFWAKCAGKSIMYT